MIKRKGKIYELISGNFLCKKRYIGSTIHPQISQRLAAHTYEYKKFIETGKQPTRSYEVLQYGDVKIRLLEIFEFTDIMELRQREQEWIDANDDCANKIRAYMTQAQRKEQIDKEHAKKSYKLYQTRYMRENIKKMRVYQQRYRHKNKDKMKLYQREYRKTNKERQIEYQRKYYNKFKYYKTLLK